jgi:hypothetical protein
MEKVHKLHLLHDQIAILRRQADRLERSDALRVLATACVECQRKGEFFCDHDYKGL